MARKIMESVLRARVTSSEILLNGKAFERTGEPYLIIEEDYACIMLTINRKGCHRQHIRIPLDIIPNMLKAFTMMTEGTK